MIWNFILTARSSEQEQCCFGIGFEKTNTSTTMSPCCLETFPCKNYDRKCEEMLIAGTIGKANKCPTNAHEASTVIQNMEQKCLWWYSLDSVTTEYNDFDGKFININESKAMNKLIHLVKKIAFKW